MKRLAGALWMVWLVAFAGCALSGASAAGSYRGQVVDEETGQPLPGALVVFFWFRDVYSPVTKQLIEQLHAVVEVRADAYGYFEVSSAPETSGDPSVVEARKTDPIFFVPGYFAFYKGKTEGEPFRDPTIVALRRARNPRDAVERLPILPSVFAHTPLLLQAVNQERARFGLPPIRPAQKGGGNE